MRLLKRIERSFISNLVAQTRTLVASERLVYEKIAMLQFSAAHHHEKAERMREVLEEQTLSAERTERALAIIGLREKAAGYLKATAKFLKKQADHPYSLARMPRMFSVPGWHAEEEKIDLKVSRVEPVGIPFMEFSS